MNQQLRLCIHCANYRKIGLSPECHAEPNMIVSPVDGQRKARLPNDFLRENDSYCGPSAGWFREHPATADKEFLPYPPPGVDRA
jgi:hypothetical protein